ncbi:flagellar biosynthesis protein FlhB [uncultured Pelagimonas sp.]|uniref:EscU/YscU/HrcU family type III secretion system export apparatus switch protein n=1 Tax=uncultured Pelagimonas sp. TaxID=1618102 RepID=UPI002619D1BB|nr:flagellar type III secretion system protein FlhB [uncultured Pelagimonas sp.]
MSDQDESSEKSHEPSQKKLDDARKKGEIPRATDLLTAMGYLGLLMGVVSFGGYILTNFANVLLPFLEQPERLTSLFFGGNAKPATAQLLSAGLAQALPLLFAPTAFVLLTLFATRGFAFSGAKLKPKGSRLSPLENAKNKYGRRGLFEFFKSFVKLSIYSVLLTLFIKNQLDEIVGAVRTSPGEVFLLILSLVTRFLFIVVLIAMTIGGIDAFWQKAEHVRKNRMSFKELKDEMKEAEGDPYLKQHRRMKAQELALNQMMAEVPEADVVIVNPTHYAVALKWSRMAGTAPECVAKGVDEVAHRIREIANEAGVPIHSDPPTARALFATVDVGQEIDPDHYQPVAAAIRFAQNMREKARGKGWS